MALSHAPKIITDNLVCLLDAGNTNSYPGTGSTWTDLSGNGNNFTISGATYNTSPKRFTFGDNEGDYILRSSSDVIGNLDNFSFTASETSELAS